MLIGWVIEIMILKEIMFITQMELYLNKDQWNELRAFYIARANLEQFLDDLKNGQLPLNEGSAIQGHEQEKLLEENHTNSVLPGKQLRSSLNGQKI